MEIEFTKIARDINGNPRYVFHFLDLLSNKEKFDNKISLDEKYKTALKISRLYGGKKYNTKKYGGGIVFQSFNIQDLCTKISKINK